MSASLNNKPEILAPAGDMNAFLAALAAGADAVYVGLKHFSARMQAENFSLTELSRMVMLANKHSRRVYIAFNTLVKPNDISSAANLIARLARDVKPHALIIQDLGLAEIARQVGYKGEIHFSTLSNLTHSQAFDVALKCGASRVLLPREFSIDEIKEASQKCPEELDFEIFIHGALCYCVSGRCYWSSYMGGKSGLRGRCVQPCRRIYKQKSREGRFFSALDFSLDILVRSLKEIQHLKSWKIEGRKKGAHYVYHTVTAYKMLRDEGDDPQVRKMAERLLKMALGRESTRAKFLPQRESNPAPKEGQTSSGLLIGKVQIDEKGQAFIKPHQPMINQDYLRIGSEDEKWHATMSVRRSVPKAGTLSLKLPRHKTPKAGTPVFLIDRREPELIALLQTWQKDLDSFKVKEPKAAIAKLDFPERYWGKPKISDMKVRSSIPTGMETRRSRGHRNSIWLSPRASKEISRTVAKDMAWWLPPVIWQNEEDSWKRLIREVVRNGAKNFVTGSPWQIGLFDNIENLNIIAGPFCNVSNAYATNALKNLGFKAAFASPELSKEDFMLLPSTSALPLGVLISGFFPVAISRFEPALTQNEVFSSPKKEQFWIKKYGQNTWIFPAWQLDLSEKKQELQKAGYSFFASLSEYPPSSVQETNRSGLFNWENDLL